MSTFSTSCLHFQFVIFIGVDFDLIVVIFMSFCITTPHLIHIGPTRGGVDILSIAKMAVVVTQYYFRFRIW